MLDFLDPYFEPLKIAGKWAFDTALSLGAPLWPAAVAMSVPIFGPMLFAGWLVSRVLKRFQSRDEYD